MSLIRKLIKLLPELRIKNTLRCFYYNHFLNIMFRFSYKDNYFITFDKHHGYSFKSYDNPVWCEIFSVIKYLDNYNIKKGDIVIDGGAFVGLFTLFAAKIVGKTGKVIAFEPDPHNYEKLLKNIKLNSFKNVIALNQGLWNSESELELHNKGVWSSFLIDTKHETITTTCPVTSIDVITQKMTIPQINFIKMDIEGAELEAIKGAKRILSNGSVNLAIASYHIVNGEPTYIKLEKLFKNYGYKAQTNTSVCNIITYAKRNSS